MSVLLSVIPRTLLNLLEDSSGIGFSINEGKHGRRVADAVEAIHRSRCRKRRQAAILVREVDEEGSCVYQIWPPDDHQLTVEALEVVRDKSTFIPIKMLSPERVEVSGLSIAMAPTITKLLELLDREGKLAEPATTIQKENTMSNELIEIGALWLAESKAGKKFMSGRFGNDARILCFKNERKEKNSHPDYRLFLAPSQRQEDKDESFKI